MMTKCPKCESTEIIPELILFGNLISGKKPARVILVDPSKKADDVIVGFYADICGSCGHTEFYTKKADLLLEAHKKGFISQTPQ
jgi:predicted nucleic-acid-binding Zn-ribbon protein